MKSFLIICLLSFAIASFAGNYTVVYEASTLTVKDVIENKASFGKMSSGLRYGKIEAETSPQVGDVLSSEPEDGKQRFAIATALQAEIDALNVKYSISLSIDDSFAKASAKLFGAGALKSEVTYLKTLFDALKEME